MKLSPGTKLTVALIFGMAVSIGVLVFSELSHRRLMAANDAMAQSIETQVMASQTLGLVTDAEAGMRGFLIAEQNQYLDPYNAALPRIDPQLASLERLVAGDQLQLARVNRLRELIGKKFAELDASLSLYRTQGVEAARDLVKTDIGRQTTEQIRREIEELQNDERAELVARAYEWNQDVANSRFGISLITAFNVALLIAVYLYASREIVQRDRARRRLLQSQRMLEAEVRERTMELSALSSDLQRLQEEEKSKLARELHDEMGSILVSAKMDVSWALSRIRDTHPQCAEKLARALMVLDDGVEVKRRIVDDLRPALLDNLGLGSAIAWHTEQMSERSGLQCHVSVPEQEAPLSADAAIALFRIVQEALTNVVRHAKATNAWIELQQTPHNAVLTVRDDGVGLPAESYRTLRAHGIASMRQRVLGVGGEFEIKGERGKGTTIRVLMPLIEEIPRAEPASDGVAMK